MSIRSQQAFADGSKVLGKIWGHDSKMKLPASLMQIGFK